VTFQKCTLTSGKVVINNTRWLSEDALTLKNALIELRDLYELDRTLDDTVDRLQDTLADRAIEDDINECNTCCQGHSMLFQLLSPREQS